MKLVCTCLIAIFCLSSQLHLKGQTNFSFSDGPTIEICDGFFVDSGGDGINAPYSPNEDQVITICPDASSPGSLISLTFEELELSEFFTEDGDSLFFYSGGVNGTLLEKFGPKQNLAENLTISTTEESIDGCLTVVFQSDGSRQGEGWRARVQCRLPCQTINARLANSVPTVTNGYIDACPGEEITFNGGAEYPENNTNYSQSDATSLYEWNFGDGTVAIGQNAVHVYENPGGYVVQLTITDLEGCTNSNFISQRVRISPRPAMTFASGLDTAVCSMDELELELTEISSRTERFVPGANTPSSPKEIPDGIGVSIFDSITIAQFSPGQRLNSIDELKSICVNMEHAFLRDLEIRIICPSGEFTTLTNFSDEDDKIVFLGEAIQFDELNPIPGIGYDYCWTPTSTNGTWVEFTETAGSRDTLPPGDYQSDSTLTKLVGCELNGIWKLEILDNQEADNGTLFSWGVEFDTSIFPVIEEFTPVIIPDDYGWQASNANITNQTNEQIIASPNVAGDASFTFSVRDEFGCTFDTTFVTEVRPVTHPDCLNCTDDLIASTDTTVCEGATVAIDASPSTIPEDIIFSFQDDPNQGFSKSPVQLGSVYESTVDVNSILPTVITDVNTTIESICLNATIDPAAPFSIVLVSPLGRRMILVEEGTIGQFQNACFTPTATESINTAIPPYNDVYSPSAPFSIINGEEINQTWRLEVQSASGPIDAGALGSWSISFRGEPSYTYLWTPAAGLSCTDCATPQVVANETTTYRVEVSNAFNCNYTDSITVIVDPSVTDLAVERFDTTGIDCFGNANGALTAIVSGGTGNYTYSWNDPLQQTQQTASFLAPNTTFTVTVRDEEGCIVRDSLSLWEPEVLTVAAMINDVACKGEATGEATVIVNGGVGPFNYLWSTNDNMATASNLIAGSYTVSVTDNNNCPATATATIVEPAEALTVTIDQTFRGCFGESNNEIQAIPSGGTGNFYTFLWSNGATTSSIDNLDTIIYTTTIIDEANCELTASFTPQDLEQITFDFLHVKPTCEGINNGQIGIDNISGGTGSAASDYSIQWSNAATSNVIENLAGDMTYSATVTDAQGCFTEGSFLLQNPEEITFEFAVQSTTCFNASDGSIEVINIEGPGIDRNYSYTWDGPANEILGPFASNLPAGNYNVTVSDTEGCNSSAMAIIPEPNPILANITTEDNRCFGESLGSIALQPNGGNGGFSYNWSTGSVDANLNLLPAGTYEVTITDQSGCTLEENIIISEPNIVTIDLETIDPTCFESRDGAISSILVSGGTTPYMYSLDNLNFEPTNNVFGLPDGEYTVFVKDANDCVYIAETELNHPPELVIQAINPNYQIQLGDSTQLEVTTLNAQGNVTYTFVAPYGGTLSCTDCPNPISRPDNTITYQVNGIDEVGCRASELIQVVVEKIRTVRVPSGFTPDGLGPEVNNALHVHGRPGTIVTLFQIYDRWGELLYETKDFAVNDLNIGWDGTFRGKEVDAGTYIWYVEVEYIDGARQAFRGETSVIR